MIGKDKIEELIEEKVEERVQEELHKREIKEGKRQNKETKSSISRRDFLKKLGVGALGIGALSLPTASALNLRSNNLQFYGGSGETNVEFEVDSDGNIKAFNTLNMNKNSINFDDNNYNSGADIDSLNTLNVANITSNRGSDPIPVQGGFNINQNATLQVNGNNVLTTADEGSGNNLDADTVDGHNVFVQSSQPSNPDTNDIWIDTS